MTSFLFVFRTAGESRHIDEDLIKYLHANSFATNAILSHETFLKIQLTQCDSGDEEVILKLHFLLKKYLYPNKIDYLLDSGIQKRLVVFDMDSTLIQEESLDLLGKFAGFEHEVSRITQKAITGEIEFSDAINRRVAMLAGMSVNVVDTIFETQIHLQKGAMELMQTIQNTQTFSIVASGGFTHFAKNLQNVLGFDEYFANHLEVKNDLITGRVVGSLVDDFKKLEVLNAFTKKLGLQKHQTIAVGDGSNDILMLKGAGLGVAFMAKDIVKQSVQNQINFNGLDVLKCFFEPADNFA